MATEIYRSKSFKLMQKSNTSGWDEPRLEFYVYRLGRRWWQPNQLYACDNDRPPAVEKIQSLKEYIQLAETWVINEELEKKKNEERRKQWKELGGYEGIRRQLLSTLNDRTI